MRPKALFAPASHNAVADANMEVQCENREPAEKWFLPDSECIREIGDIPQALVEAPIRPEWVVRIEPAGQAFLRVR